MEAIRRRSPRVKPKVRRKKKPASTGSTLHVDHPIFWPEFAPPRDGNPAVSGKGMAPFQKEVAGKRRNKTRVRNGTPNKGRNRGGVHGTAPDEFPRQRVIITSEALRDKMLGDRRLGDWGAGLVAE